MAQSAAQKAAQLKAAKASALRRRARGKNLLQPNDSQVAVFAVKEAAKKALKTAKKINKPTSNARKPKAKRKKKS